MTGREAIEVVRRLSPIERLRTVQTTKDATLKLIARIPTEDYVGWLELLEIVGTIEVAPPALEPLNLKERGSRSGMAAAVAAVWRQKPWTIRELSEATGHSVVTLRNYQRTAFRSHPWRTVMVGRHEKAYQLLDRSDVAA